jgi:hypothetical protein
MLSALLGLALFVAWVLLSQWGWDRLCAAVVWIWSGGPSGQYD